MRLIVFDENLISTSPAGSCLLKVVQSMAGETPLHIYFNRLELADGPLVQKTRIPLPPGPVVLRTILFTLFASLRYFLSKRSKDAVTIGTEGVFPFCDICYAHCCHRVLLKKHRHMIGGRFFRRTARLILQWWGTFTERIAFRSARMIVVPSRGLARELESVYPALVAGKIHVIANPVDVAAFAKPADFPGAPDETLRLCFCALGNFEHKGLRLTLEALKGTAVRLTVVGGSPGEISEYQTVARKLQVDQLIHFTGLQSDIRPYLWASDAFLFPSAHETFPLVCLQAAAAGLALITTRVYGVEEYMEDGVTGWFIERNAASIAGALKNRNELRRMGGEAQKRAAAYGEDRFVNTWKLLLRQAG